MSELSKFILFIYWLPPIQKKINSYIECIGSQYVTSSYLFLQLGVYVFKNNKLKEYNINDIVTDKKKFYLNLYLKVNIILQWLRFCNDWIYMF